MHALPALAGPAAHAAVTLLFLPLPCEWLGLILASTSSTSSSSAVKERERVPPGVLAAVAKGCVLTAPTLGAKVRSDCLELDASQPRA